MPATAQASSLSEVSPEIPTAPIVSPFWSWISTPPGAAITRPWLAAVSVVMNIGAFCARSYKPRDPNPMPNAP
jgi:hypothetical protein